MAFLKRKNPKRRVRASKSSRIQEIRSPYAHRKLKISRKITKKSGKTKYSSEIKVSYRNKNQLKKWILIIGGFILAIFILYITVFTNFFQVKEWKIFEDNIIQDGSKFEDFLSVHKGENLVFLDTNEIKNTIISQYPEIQNLNIKKVFPGAIIMEYENFPEAANLINLVGDTQKKFVINSIGLLVEKDYENPNLPFIKIRTEKALDLDEFALPAEKLEYILDSIYDFEEIFGMKIVDAEFKSREKEVHLKTERDFMIWLDCNLTVLQQYSKLKSALNKLNIYTESLEYIDLRISSINGEKIIYKRR